jgi:phosphoribosylanthranilate isomerase
MPYYNYQELIVQQRDADNIALYESTRDVYHGGTMKNRLSVLLDASGGQGIDTPINVLNGVSKVGYAGGFNPDNVAGKLEYLLKNVKLGMFWIDMESGVRTDDWFDTSKVRRVLAICKEVIRDLGMEE